MKFSGECLQMRGLLAGAYSFAPHALWCFCGWRKQGSAGEWAANTTCLTPLFYNFPKIPGLAFKHRFVLLSPITPAKLQLGLNHYHLHRGFIYPLGKQLKWALLYQCQIFEQLLVIYISSATGTGSTEKQTTTPRVQLPPVLVLMQQSAPSLFVDSVLALSMLARTTVGPENEIIGTISSSTAEWFQRSISY